MSSLHPDAVVTSDHSLLQQPDSNISKKQLKNINKLSKYKQGIRIISYYFEYLAKDRYRSNRDFLFIAPEVTECIKMVPETEMNNFMEPLGARVKPYIFFAVSDYDPPSGRGGSYWSLLVFSRPNRTFYHFDTTLATNTNHCQNLVCKMKYAMNCSTARCISLSCLEQNSEYDCGIHLLCMVDHLTEHIIFNDCVEAEGVISAESVRIKRGDVLRILSYLNDAKRTY